jgi:diguanylate cyclase (GGDEF)-like protein
MRILVADDSGVSRYMICTYLRDWGHDVIAVKDGGEALEVLQRDTGISLALVDWMMPGLDGIEVCRQLRATSDRAYTYMIAVTSRTEKQDLVCALEAGFDDFLTKPVQPEELNARLVVGRRIVDLQQKLIDSNEVSQYKATHDSLTGLWNRGAIQEFLRAQLAMTVRNSRNLSLIMLDVDHFKKINDTHGHPIGDSVLIHISQLLNSAIRASDLLGRYGGEEFLLVAPECPAENAIRLAERMRLTVFNNPLVQGELTVSSTISLGVVNSSSIESPTLEALVRLVDAALYRAKTNGRNRIEVDSNQTPIPRSGGYEDLEIDPVSH